MSNQKQQDRSNPKLREQSRLISIDTFGHRFISLSRNNAHWKKWAKKKMSKRRRRHGKEIAKGEQ